MTDKELVERLRTRADGMMDEWDSILCNCSELVTAASRIEQLHTELTKEKIDNTNLIGELATVAAERDRYKAVHENPQPSTNADRIRAMDDKELAEFIDRCEAAGYNDSSVALDKNNNLMDTLDWLQQPAEEAR